MFQYAFGYALAKQNKTELLLDTRFFTKDFLMRNPHFTKQSLNLFKFPIDYRNTINEDASLKIINILQKRFISRIIRIPKHFTCKADNGLQYIKETRLDVMPKIKDDIIRDVYLDGYWQSQEYFKDYKKDLVRQFCYVSENAEYFAITNNLSDDDSVAVHIRMGDYGNKKKFANYNYVINPQYYKDSINEVRKRIHNARFFICSNNIQKAKELLGEDSSYIYVNSDRKMSDLDEFKIMSMCRNHIISNSTFSWWAAWLADGEHGITIAPNIVFGNKHIIPENWVKLDVHDE
jgi:hypothetical protein